jgi:branched-subunit amino acid ABC-type transport system permease component
VSWKPASQPGSWLPGLSRVNYQASDTTASQARLSFRTLRVGALGIDVPRLYTGVFALGSWLAGVGGALAAPVGSISLGLDSSIIIESFAVVIIGGVGSVGGALLGSIIIGVTKSIGILFAPKLAIAFIFIALCAVLVFRPQGLLGRATS